MKTFYLLLISSLVFSTNSATAQSSWDDFDNPGKVVYPFINGTIFNQSFANPSTTGVNTSALCAQYARNGGALYDVILAEPVGLTKIGNVSGFRAGTKSMTMKIYSPAVGKTVQITLENKNSAGPTNYPTGRHSEYSAVTTVANSWETLTFTLIGSPDLTVPDTSITTLVILFDPNTNNSDTYLFDDLMGPDLIDPCAGTTPLKSIGDDYECQRNVTFDFANGTHFQTQPNPLTTGINPSPVCGKFLKYLPPSNDGAFGGTLSQPFTSDTFNVASIELYSPSGSVDFKLVFQDAQGNDLLDTLFVTPTTPGWTKFEMNLTNIPNSTPISKFVYLLNSPTATLDSVFLDNLSFSFDITVGIKENNADLNLDIYPNPFDNQVIIKSETAIKTITVMDITGKTLFSQNLNHSFGTTINLENLFLGTYFIQILDENGNIKTEKIVKTSK